ncbi:MAG: serine dehydratase subunit alpha family protein [Bacteroidales bacterium]|nr:serine dehydratase subunit alpha family protein [Bacteroidales bacterium]MBQ2913503.1 serine dehydratase subunit alpha family protein [Bacteroidales bacterium]
MTLQRELEIIELIQKEVKPALGCTEPIAVSLAVARSCEALRQIGVEVSHLTVEVSANILKNGMGVGIPGTGMIGLHIASALAVTCGKSCYGLEVLKDLSPAAIDAAKEMVDAKKVKVVLADTTMKLYIKAWAYGSDAAGVEHSAATEIKNNHDSIVSVVRDGEEILAPQHIEPMNCAGSACTSAAGASAASGSAASSAAEKTTLDYKLSVKEILEFAQEASFENIKFILDSVKLNKALAMEGLKDDYGLRVGKTILAREHSDVFGSSVMTYAMAATAAASDARMAGCTLPAMSNSGSGNQGITVTMPVIAVAEKMGVGEEQLARALVLSHLVAIHIKGYLGKLSALCGCVIASTGSSCGIVYLHGGGYEQVCSAIKNMVGNITGMVCDGAKVGCALKVASGVSSSVQAAVLAMDNICISSNDGIIEDCIEKTICNLGRIGAEGMQTTDRMILDIMVCK